jgi:hypothetical protein
MHLLYSLLHLSQNAAVHASTVFLAATAQHVFLPHVRSPALLKIVDITLKQSLSGGLDSNDINNDIRGLLEMKNVKGEIQFKKNFQTCALLNICAGPSMCLRPH